MEERDQFTFYSSFAKSIKRIKKAGDRAAAYDAIVDYALYGIVPDLDKLPDAAAIVFELSKPNLDSSRRKAENGKRGGSAEANRKQTASKEEAKPKQSESKIEIEKEYKKKNNSYPPISPQRGEELIRDSLSDRSSVLIETVVDWLRYKTERKETYRETGFRALLTQIHNNAVRYGDQAMADVINRTMSQNYQGIVYDWLGKRPKTNDLSGSYAMMEDWANG